MWASRKNSGFTIVELLIVVVVIGVLAAIVIVAYNGITASAQKSATTSELKQWEKLIMLYKARHGSYPMPAANPTTDGGPGASVDDYWCLGTGFPEVSGTAYCYAYGGGAYRVEESRNATLLSLLAENGTPPQNSAKYIYGGVVGPVLRWLSSTDVRLYGIYPPDMDCVGAGLLEGYGNTTRRECYIRLQ